MRSLLIYLTSCSLLVLGPHPLSYAQSKHPTCQKIEVNLEKIKNEVDPSAKDSLAVPYFMDLCARAVSGDHDAQFELAMHFRKGWHAPRDREEAFRWYLAASEGGNLTAQAITGANLIFGGQAQRDVKRGLEMLKDAADKKDPTGMGMYGDLLRLGLPKAPPEQLVGVDFQMDSKRGVRLIREAAEAGYATAALQMSFFTEVNGRTPESQQWLKRAAQGGNPDAQYHYAQGYLWGHHGEKDVSKYLEHTMYAAINGSRYARWALGRHHKFGTYNLPLNYSLAEFWFRKAVEVGSYEAERELAERSQWGVERKTPLTQGDVVAMTILGLFALGVVAAAVSGEEGGQERPRPDNLPDERERYQQAINGACAWMTQTEAAMAGCP